jgi:thiol-disulfide isomerase/thioredoxin
MTKNTTVILIKASWCGYCKRFTPIFEKTKKNNSKKYKFEIYDLGDENSKDNNIFHLNHYKSKDLIDGYPTILIKKNNKYIKIDHTIIDDEDNENQQIDKASAEFFINIENGIKNLDAKDGQVFAGGGYKQKYYKYKTKYLIIKNNM